MQFDELDELLNNKDLLYTDDSNNKSQAIRLSDVSLTDDTDEWIIPGYVPIGDCCMVTGLPGSGKSSIVASWVSAVTTGSEWLGLPVIEGNVLYIFLEDKLSKLAKMLHDNGADRKRVHALQDVSTCKPVIKFKSSDRLKLPDDTKTLMTSIREHKPTVIVVDAISRLTNRVSKIEQEEIASLFLSIAQQFGIGVIYINHLKPGKYAVDNIVTRLENPLYHQICRGSFYSVKDEITEIRAIIDIKNNHADNAPFLYRIQKNVYGEVRVVPVYNQILLNTGRIDDNKLRGMILSCINENGPMTPIQLAQETGINHNTVKQYVVRMHEKGMLQKLEGYRYALSQVIIIAMDNKKSEELQELQQVTSELQQQTGYTSEEVTEVTTSTEDEKLFHPLSRGIDTSKEQCTSEMEQTIDEIIP